MDIAYFSSAFLLGFLGSFHCAGMCGPLVFMLPGNSGSTAKMLQGRFVYNSGRILTYIVLGLLFGMFGFALALKGFQKEISVITGIIIIFTVLFTSGQKGRLQAYEITNSYSGSVRKLLKKLFAKKGLLSLFLIGVLNGLLPCGFVYLAIAGSVAGGSVINSAVYMALFGLGTFPIMMSISIAANYLGLSFRRVFSKITPLISIGLALFLIYRGTDMKTSACSNGNHIVKVNCIAP